LYSVCVCVYVCVFVGVYVWGNVAPPPLSTKLKREHHTNKHTELHRRVCEAVRVDGNGNSKEKDN
jgi:hypothetical protein